MIIRLKILHVVQYDFETLTGGIQKYVKELAEIQSKDGNEVIIFSCSNCNTITYLNNITIQRFRYFEMFRTPISLTMILKFIKTKVDIVHIHAQFPIVGELIALLAKLKGIPVITTYHNEVDLTKIALFSRIAYIIWSKTLLKILLSISNYIIVTTNEFASTSSILSKVDKDKIHFIPCGIFITKTEITNEPKNYLLYVGRIKPEKGIHILLQALALSKQNGLNLYLYIVGEASRIDEIEYKRELDVLIKDLDIQERVKFFGKVSEEQLEHLYKHAIALVLPSISRLEGFGIVQLEAMAHGVPVIVSDISGPKSVSKGASIVVKPNDPYDLYKSILTVIDKDIRNSLAKSALERVLEYDWNALYKRIKKLYDISKRG